jgi:hypothetical protein
MHVTFIGDLHDDRHSDFHERPFAESRSDRERSGIAVVTLQTPLDVSEADACAPSLLKGFGCRSSPRVLNDE